MYKKNGLTSLLYPLAVVVFMFILTGCATPPSQQGFSLNGFMLRDVFFDFNRTTISADAKVVLERNAKIMKKSGSSSIVIEGYADVKGSKAYNKSLSSRRARSAKRYLVSLGIDSSRIKTVGKGETTMFTTWRTWWFRITDDPGLNRRAHFQPG